MEIHKLTPQNATELSYIHLRSFKNFFLTSLGKTFLISFYSSVLSDPNGLGYGIYENNILKGFVVGTLQSQGFYRKLALKNFNKLFSAALPSLLRKPFLFFHLFRSLTSSGQNPSNICLLSICVDITSKGLGLGTMLLKEFENAIASPNIYWLTTDRINNDAVNSFYKKNGFIESGLVKQGKRILNIYTKSI